MFFRIRVAHFSVFCVIFLSVLFFVFVFMFRFICWIFLLLLLFCLVFFMVCLLLCLLLFSVLHQILSVSLDCLCLWIVCLWIVCVSGLSVSLDCPLTIASSVFFKIFFMKNGKNIVKKDRNNILYMYINLCMIY